MAERPRRSPWEAAAVPRVPPDEARPTAERQSPPAGVLTPAAAHRRIKHARARWHSPFPRRERLRRARAIWTARRGPDGDGDELRSRRRRPLGPSAPRDLSRGTPARECFVNYRALLRDSDIRIDF